ncbi:ABC transporter permease [Hamadaea tsunoensis]|uniref:ABC transporter permease n=1 Tax=Hamadaea tsunoensis TaxID=53368 RepID=UPI000423BBE8|nr:ABC transporter permease [Hamadaea tsunoensis]
MTATTLDTAVVAPAAYWTRARKTGLILTVLGVIATVVFGALASSRSAHFSFGTDVSGAAMSIPGRLGAIVFGLVALGAGLALYFTQARYGLWTSISLAAFVISSLCWQISRAATGDTIALGLLAQLTVLAALPLIYGSISGVLCEKTGVVNVAIEGQLLTGAFFAAFVGSVTHNPWLGLIAAALGGVLISALLAFFAIRYVVEQVVIGIVLNSFALGITGYLYEQIMQKNAAYNSPGSLPVWEIPLLSKIPILGPAVFTGTILTYGAFLVVAVVAIALTRTRWGLRTRAVGEHPTAADTLGVRVLGLRWANVLMAGVVAGFGGAYFSMVSATSFTKNLTGGAGFIALAAMIFGRWQPIGAFLAALFFGFAGALASILGSIATPIPSAFLNMLPYIATIFAVAGLVGRVRAPAADGKPWVKGH